MTLLDATRERLSTARERKTLPRRSPPSFVRSGDILARAYAAQDLLLGGGEIVFGVVLLHQSSLAEQGDDDGGGFVLYTHDPIANEAPSTVESIADWLRDAIGKRTPHPGLALVTDALAVPTPIARTALPIGLTAAVQYYVSAIPLRRIDLPDGRLRSTFLPVLADPEMNYVLPLPLPLWADDLVAAWIDRSA